jgi:hypothetical protein
VAIQPSGVGVRGAAGTQRACITVVRNGFVVGEVRANGDTFEAVTLPSGNPIGWFASAQDARSALQEDRPSRLDRIQKPTQPAVSKRLRPIAGRMQRRRSELVRLAAFRRHAGVDFGNPEQWALVIADVLSFCPCGTDYLTHGKMQRDAGIELPEEVVMAAIHAVARRWERKGRRYRPFSDLAVGRKLGLTLVERLACSIRTIAAVDETAEERRARQKDRRRAYECERSRRRRSAAKADSEARDKAQCLSKKKPWLALGISRATWYRRGKPDCSTCPESH